MRPIPMKSDHPDMHGKDLSPYPETNYKTESEMNKLVIVMLSLFSHKFPHGWMIQAGL